MKVTALAVDFGLLAFFLWVLVFDTPSSDVWMGLIVIAAVLLNIIGLVSSADSWPILYLRRKAMEERRRIAKLTADIKSDAKLH